MSDDQRVVPHILRRDMDTEREQVAIAHVEGVPALVVPISEEIARRCTRVANLEGLEPEAATVEDIEQLCAHHGIGFVGLFGLDDGGGFDVLSVETVGLVLTAG